MSNSNQSRTPEVDDLLESLIGLYVNSPNVSPPERNNPARDNRYPLSFNLQQPRQSLFSRTSPTTPNYSVKICFSTTNTQSTIFKLSNDYSNYSRYWSTIQ